jgi:hypothetical protein
MSDIFHIQNYLNQGDALSLLIYNKQLGRSKKMEGLELNGTCELLVC